MVLSLTLNMHTWVVRISAVITDMCRCFHNAKKKLEIFGSCIYSKTCVKRPLSKRPKNGFQDKLLLNAGHKYCRMLLLEHSAMLSTFIKQSVVIKTSVLSIFEWPFYTGFTVLKMKCTWSFWKFSLTLTIWILMNSSILYGTMSLG